MATAQPKPPALPDDDVVFKIVGSGFRRLGQVLWYWIRRTRQDFLVGLVYLLTWPPALALLVQNARQAFANATAPAFMRPTRIWPLGGHPLPVVGLILVVVLLLLTWIFDYRRARGRARRTKQQADAPASAPLRFTPNEWVVGWIVERTWNPDPGEWVLHRTHELFALTAEHLRVNLLVVAPQGAGKTSMVLHPILRLCRRLGAACLVFDVKGDPEEPEIRPDFDPQEFHITFDFAHPERSARLNLAASGTPREIGEQLGEALIYDPGADKTYFVNNAKDALGSLYAAHHAAYGDIPDFRQTLLYLRNPQSRSDLLEELRKVGRTDTSDEVLDLTRIDQLQESKNDVLGNLDLALAPLARGGIADLLVADDSGLRISDLLREGARVRIILPVYRQPRVAPIVGRLILAQFTNAVLDPACNRNRLKAALVDEARWFVTPSMPSGMAQARANFGGYVLAFQDTPQIHDEHLRDEIWSVATNKVVLPGVNGYDQEKFSREWGARERLYISHSRQQSTSTNTSRSTGRGQHSGGFGGGAGSTQTSTARSASANEGQGESRQTRLRPDWLPAEIHSLPKYHAIVERRDAQGNLTPPTMIALDHAALTQIQLQQDLQLYRQSGRRDASSFRLPAPSSLKPAALAQAVSGSPAGRSPESVTASYNPREVAQLQPATDAQPVPLAETVIAGYNSAEVIPEPEGAERNEGAASPAIPATAPRNTVQPDQDVAPGTRNWTGEAVQVIIERLPIDQQTAAGLVAKAQQNGRTLDYITELIEYIHSQPNIVLPAKVFQRLVETNQDRRRRSSRRLVQTGSKPQEG